MTRRQRTVFGEVAETYDEVRASYPDSVIDNVAVLTALESGSSVLDVGCGTGILAEPFISRGHKVLGIDPSSGMARIARRKFAGNPNFRLHLVDFQTWSPGSDRFDLVVAGQSWHWMDPDTRFHSAASALRGNGHLVLFWNTANQMETPIRAALGTAYAEHTTDMPAGPPGSKTGLNGREPHEEIAEADRFELLDVVEEAWSATYATDAYLRLLGTQSDHRLLDDSRRSALFDAIADAIDDIGGGHINVQYICRAFVAKLT